MHDNISELLAAQDNCPSPMLCSENCPYIRAKDCHAERIADLLIKNDVVEVVRCKDCKKWEQNKPPFDITRGTCHNQKFHFYNGDFVERCFMPNTYATDFCSYGERKAK